MNRRLVALALAAGLAACAPAGHPDLAAAVQPRDIAYATCLQYHPGDTATCGSVHLPNPDSETAYQLCLDYHPIDAKTCLPVRGAYEAELRAFLTEPRPAGTAPVGEPVDDPSELSGRGSRRSYRTAEQLYIATSRDAETFEAALLIPEVRRKVERVLGPGLTDKKLHALAQKSRAEALHWYEYMQQLERADSE